MAFWKFILLMAIYLDLFANSSSFIQTIVKGNLSHSWNLNVSLFAKDLKGIVLYCVDYEQNKLSIRVTIARNTNKYIHLSYNNAFIRSPLHQTCGCDPCDDKIMNLFLELNNGSISVLCNKYGRDSLMKSSIKDNIPQLILETMKNLTNSIFVGMGNVDGTEDLIGCLTMFSFNKTQLKFRGKGTEFLPSCKVKCSEGMCNKGKCGAPYPPGPFCDCSNAALNGRYCNRTMMVYNMTQQHSYRRQSILKNVQFKLTWKPSFKKRYCLMELIYGTGHVTFYITEDHLMRDMEVLSPIITGEVNFVNVNITDAHLSIKILEKIWLIELPLAERFRVNLGYTGLNAKCEIFEGKYDLHYNRSQLIRIPSTSGGRKINIWWILLPILCIILLICGIGLALFIRQRMANDESPTENELVKLNVDQGTVPTGDDSANT